MRKFVLGVSAALAVAAAESAAAPPAPVVPVMPSEKEIAPAQAMAPIESIGGTPIDFGGSGAPVVSVGASDVLTGSGNSGRAAGRFYAEASYLLMWTNDGNTNIPIATGGPSLGIVGQTGTTVLLGNSAVDYGTINGFKVAAGGFIGDSRTGIEFAGTYIGRTTQTGTAGPTSISTIGRPFRDPRTGVENSVITAAAGAFNGGVTMTNSLEAYSAELNPFFRVVDGGRVTIDLITGFRYFQHAETLNIYSGSTLQAGGVSAFNGFGLAAPASVLVHDRFGAHTTFYGANLGAKASFGSNRLFLDLTGKVAIGGVRQNVSVDGSTTVTSGGGFAAPASTQGGFLTAGQNLGERSDSRFAVLPEGNATIGYQVTSWANVFAGFTVIYLDTVARPNDQISRSFTANSIPTTPTYTRPTGQRTTAIIDDDFYLYGFNFGVTFSY